MKISVVIITFNEEKNITRCINSVKKIADEIIVVDSFSTDRTVAVAESCGAKVIQTQWQGYAATKNYGNTIATHDYILSLDADECLSDELQQSIANEKDNLEDVYEMNRLTNYCGSWIRHGGWYPDTKIRLFDRRKTQWKNLIVHETIELLEDQNVVLLDGDILHYSFLSVEDHQQKIEKYSALEAQKIAHYSILKIQFKKIFSPIATFIKTFILKQGWLDGKAGFDVARLSAYASFRRYATAIEIKKAKA